MANLSFLLYKFLEKKLARVEPRTFNKNTDIDPSEGHKFHAELTIPYIKNKKVLDIGCWSGQYTALIKNDAKSVVAIDPNKKAIDFAKKTIKGVNFIQGSALNLPFKSGSFDVVIFMDVIEHIPFGTEKECIKEINRVLRRNGKLIMSTCHRSFPSVILDPGFWAMGHRHYSKRELTHFLKKENFHVDNVFIRGGFWLFLSVFINTLTKHILRIKYDYPKFLKRKIYEDYRNKGVIAIYLFATKTSNTN